MGCEGLVAEESSSNFLVTRSQRTHPEVDFPCRDRAKKAELQERAA